MPTIDKLVIDMLTPSDELKLTTGGVQIIFRTTVKDKFMIDTASYKLGMTMTDFIRRCVILGARQAMAEIDKQQSGERPLSPGPSEEMQDGVRPGSEDEGGR